MDNTAVGLQSLPNIWFRLPYKPASNEAGPGLLGVEMKKLAEVKAVA
jgi:hypothetical protein